MHGNILVFTGQLYSEIDIHEKCHIATYNRKQYFCHHRERWTARESIDIYIQRTSGKFNKLQGKVWSFELNKYI